MWISRSFPAKEMCGLFASFWQHQWMPRQKEEEERKAQTQKTAAKETVSFAAVFSENSPFFPVMWKRGLTSAALDVRPPIKSLSIALGLQGQPLGQLVGTAVTAQGFALPQQFQ